MIGHDEVIQDEESTLQLTDNTSNAETKSEDARSPLRRAGTMDVTAMEGISILHREGVSISETADHLRSGATFKSVTEEQTEDEVTSSTSVTDDIDGTNQDVTTSKDNNSVDQVADTTSPSPAKKKDIVEKRATLQKTLTMQATMEEAKEILKDEDLGRTRSADPEIAAAVSKEEDRKEDTDLKPKRVSLERSLTMAETLEEAKGILKDEELGRTRSADPEVSPKMDPKIITPARPKRASLLRTLTMAETLEEAHNMLGKEHLGKTRSQDRKRTRANASPKTTTTTPTSRKSNDGKSSAKRKRY